MLLADDDGRHARHGAAPHLPPPYWRAIDGLEIGPRAGACGTAMHFGRRVISADIATDPDHQRRGLGRAVMEDLIDRIERAAPPHPYITLLADPPGQRLYRSLGFIDSDPSLGMRLPR